MAVTKWIKVLGARQYYKVAEFFVQVSEIEPLDSLGHKIDVEATCAESTYSGFPLVNATDGNPNTTWSSSCLTSALPTWIALSWSSYVNVSTLRLHPRPEIPGLGFRNATILGSRDSTNGIDGTWETLATGVNMGTSWTLHTLTGMDDIPKDLTHRTKIHPAVLMSTLPASLSRGFR